MQILMVKTIYFMFKNIGPLYKKRLLQQIVQQLLVL